MTTTIETYFAEGCGRCSLGGTPECKVQLWQEELQQLRRIVLACGLDETVKWGVPCYTFQGKNVLLLHPFKEYLALNFFKGALLDDPHGLLVQQTENVQAGRQIRFTNIQQIGELEAVLKAYLLEAIAVEKAGREVPMKKTEDFPVPLELQQKMAELPALKTAFEALTPGRQRGYLLHFSQPKQAKTRIARIEKYMSRIFEGKGHQDR